MSMTRLQCKYQVWRYLGEPQTIGQQAFMSGADINNWMKFAHYKVWNDMPEVLMQGEVTQHSETSFSSEDAQTAYFTLPTSPAYYRFDAMMFYPNGTSGVSYNVPYLNKKMFDNYRVNAYSSGVQTTTGDYYCTAVRGKMLITPSTSGTSPTAKLDYLPRPTIPTADTEYLDGPEDAEELICLWVAVLGAERMKNMQLAQKLRSDYKDTLRTLTIQGMTDRQHISLPPETEAQAQG